MTRTGVAISASMRSTPSRWEARGSASWSVDTPAPASPVGGPERCSASPTSQFHSRSAPSGSVQSLSWNTPSAPCPYSVRTAVATRAGPAQRHSRVQPFHLHRRCRSRPVHRRLRQRIRALRRHRGRGDRRDRPGAVHPCHETRHLSRSPPRHAAACARPGRSAPGSATAGGAGSMASRPLDPSTPGGDRTSFTHPADRPLGLCTTCPARPDSLAECGHPERRATEAGGSRALERRAHSACGVGPAGKAAEHVGPPPGPDRSSRGAHAGTDPAWGPGRSHSARNLRLRDAPSTGLPRNTRGEPGPTTHGPSTGTPFPWPALPVCLTRRARFRTRPACGAGHPSRGRPTRRP